MNKLRRFNVRLIIGMLTCAAAAGSSLAQVSQVADYPTRPVRFIVPYPPAGATDIVARIVAQKLSDSFGQPVVVENRVGGQGVIGSQLVAKSPPDGYTLLCISFPHVLNPSLHKELPYDTLNDFVPITQIVSFSNILVVPVSTPAKSVKELIALAKASPGKLNFASGGAGTSLHLSAELFKGMAGINIFHIPYKGNAEAMNGLLRGDAAMVFDTALTVLPHIKAGRVRALAVTSTERLPFMPALPTMAEAGLPGYESGSWVGMVAPAKTPAAVIKKLHTEVIKLLQLPDVKEKVAVLGGVPLEITPQQFEARLKTEIAKWGKVVRDAGIQPD